MNDPDDSNRTSWDVIRAQLEENEDQRRVRMAAAGAKYRERASVEDAHEHALQWDRSVEWYPETGRWLHSIYEVRLVADGVEFQGRGVSDDELHTFTVLPRSEHLWWELLRHHVTVTPGFTLRTFLRILDVPEPVASRVWDWLGVYRDGALHDWVRGLDMPPDERHSDTPLDYLEVYNGSWNDEDEDTDDIDYDFHGWSVPVEPGSDEVTVEHWPVGSRIPYAGLSVNTAGILDLEIRYNPEVTLWLPHTAQIAEMQERNRQRDAGEPETPYGYRYKFRRNITLRDFIKAVLYELGSARDDDDE